MANEAVERIETDPEKDTPENLPWGVLVSIDTVERIRAESRLKGNNVKRCENGEPIMHLL